MKVELDEEELTWLVRLVNDVRTSTENITRKEKSSPSLQLLKLHVAVDLRMAKRLLRKLIWTSRE